MQQGPVSLGAMVVVIKSGANPPAVGIANAGAVAFVFHGGLTPPALGERTHIVGDARLRLATAFCFTRGAYVPRS